MAVKLISVVLSIGLISPVWSDDGCRSKLVTAGEIKEMVENTGNIEVALMDKQVQSTKRCKRRLTVILPSVVRAKRIDIANAKVDTDFDIALKVIGDSLVHADSVNIGNIQGKGAIGISRKIRLKHIDTNVLNIAETNALSNAGKVKVNNELRLQRIEQLLPQTSPESKEKLLKQIQSRFKFKKGEQNE